MSFAQDVTNLIGLLNKVVIPLIIAIAGAAFLWGVFQFFFIGAGDTEAQTKGRSFMLWSIIALAVMFSAWGLVAMLRTTLGI